MRRSYFTFHIVRIFVDDQLAFFRSGYEAYDFPAAAGGAGVDRTVFLPRPEAQQRLYGRGFRRQEFAIPLPVPRKNSVRVTIERLASSGGIGTLHQDNWFLGPGKIRSWGCCGKGEKTALPTVCSR